MNNTPKNGNRNNPMNNMPNQFRNNNRFGQNQNIRNFNQQRQNEQPNQMNYVAPESTNPSPTLESSTETSTSEN